MADYTEHKDMILTIPTPSGSAARSADLVRLEIIPTLTIPPAPSGSATNIALSDSVDCVFLYDISITTFVDYTTEANEDTGDDVPLTTANPASVGDAIYIGDDSDFDWVWINLTTAGSHSLNFLVKYWDGDSWEKIPYLIINDQFTGITAFEALGYQNLGFDIPDDRAKTTINGAEKYWVKIEDSAGTLVATIPLAGRIKIGSESQELSLAISDSVTTAESLITSESTGLSDAVSISDSIAFDISTNFADSLTYSDIISFGLSLALSDTMTMGELIEFTNALVIHDNFAISDSAKFIIDSIVEDSVAIADDQVFNVLMPLDVVDIADVFMFGNHIFITDSFAINDTVITSLILSKTIAETVVVSDVVVFSLDVPISDSVSVVDSALIAFNVGISDVVPIVDSAKFNMDTVLTSIVSIVDAIQTSIVYGGFLPGQKTIAALLADPDAYELEWMPYIAIGASDIESDEAVTTELWDELFRKRGVVSVKNNTYFVRVTFGVDEPNEDDLEIKEIGIFDASSDGNMGKRWVLSDPIDKDNIDEIVVECAVTILHGELGVVTGADIVDQVDADESIAFVMDLGLLIEDSLAVSSDDISFAMGLSLGISDSFSISSDDISFGMSLDLSILDSLAISEDFDASIVGGDEWAFLNTSVEYFNVTDKNNPTRDGSFGDVNYEMIADGNYLYVGVYNDADYVIKVYDISSMPGTAVATVAAPVGSNISTPYMDLVGDYLYVGVRGYYIDGGYEGGFLIIDISNPLSPSILSFTETDESTFAASGKYPYGIHASGDYLHVIDEADYEVFDISNKASPSRAGYWSGPITCTGIAISGNYAYLCDRRYFWAYDISDLSAPLKVKRIKMKARNVVIVGTAAYVTCGSQGLNVVDISDPVNMSISVTEDTPANAFDIYYSSNHSRLFVSDYDMAGGFHVYDLNGVLKRSVLNDDYPYGVAVDQTKLYYTDNRARLVTFDISNPDNPVNTDIYQQILGYGNYLTALHNIVYVACSAFGGFGTDGFEVADTDYSTISGPRPLLTIPIDTVRLSSDCRDLKVVGDRLFVVTQVGFYVYDLSSIGAVAKLIEEGEASGHRLVVDSNGEYVYFCGGFGMAVDENAFHIMRYDGVVTPVNVPAPSISTNSPLTGTGSVTLTFEDSGSNATDWYWYYNNLDNDYSLSRADTHIYTWNDLLPLHENERHLNFTLGLRARSAAGATVVAEAVQIVIFKPLI